jgi:PadR family transcriptional regulator, regulatory protein AphA
MNLQFAILGLLTYASLTGYALSKIFDKSINNFWSASLSQIYRELAALEAKGYVVSNIQEQDDRPDKRVYTITSAGLAAFQEWLSHFPEDLIGPKRDEFMLHLFFGGKLGRSEMKKQFERFIAEREAFEQAMIDNKKKVMEIVKTFKTPAEEEDMGMRFVQRRAMMTNRTLIQWAQECLKDLNEEEGAEL